MKEDNKIIEAFTDSLPDYLRDVETASGKLFYSLTWQQLADHLTQDKTLNILDTGCGFGLTSIWLAERGHTVTGIDITPDMIEVAEQKAKEKQLTITFLRAEIDHVAQLLKGKTYDWILCHNVLGYLDHPDHVLEKLYSLLNPGGFISIITHNPASKVLKQAIVEMDFIHAKEMIKKEKEFNPLIGAYVHQYSVTTLETWFTKMGLEIIQLYGIRCVFDYIKDEGQKENPTNLKDLLDLELQLGKSSPYRDIASFYHFILQKN